MSLPRVAGLLALFCTVAWALALLAAPPERTLGATIRWVYAHASLTQVALILFAVSLFLGLAMLIDRRVYPWLRVGGWMALGLWLAGFLLSTIPARLSWGVWIAFGEPRTQMTLRVLAVGALFLALTLWVNQPRFTAIAQIALSAVVLYLNGTTSVVLHPLNPIATSQDAAIPFSYALIFLAALTAALRLPCIWFSAAGPNRHCE